MPCPASCVDCVRLWSACLYLRLAALSSTPILVLWEEARGGLFLRLSILIIDDNSYEREALRACIPWHLLGIDEIRLAENGRKGWALYCEHRPQIILTDIKMPEMDGMEFVRRVRAEDSKTRILFLSAYDDFRYAQFALSHNADHYLLKPVNSKELVEVIRKAVDEVITEELDAEERAAFYAMLEEVREAGMEKYVRRYLLESLTPQERGELYLQMGRVCKLSFVPPLSVAVFRFREKQEYKRLQALLSRLSGSLEPAASLVLDTQSLVLILHKVQESRSDFAAKLNQTLDALPEQGALAVGVSSLTDNAMELRELYQQAVSCTNRCERHGYGRCFFVWDRYDMGRSNPDKLDACLERAEASMLAGTSPRHALEGIAESLEPECDLSSLKGAVIRYAGRLINESQVRWICDSDPELLSEEALYTALIRADSVPALTGTLGDWMETVAERFAYQSVDKKQKTALQIKHIIDTEYAGNITLKYLSGKVYLSGNYIHILFKSIYGHTVNHYLTEVRIQKACQLLSGTGYGIAQIATMVGYEHNTYFFSIFKRMTGMTPAEYRRAHQEEDA